MHYSDVIMVAMGCQITSLTIVYSTVYSGVDQRKHQSSVTGEFPAQMASNAENISIWWRHLGYFTVIEILRALLGGMFNVNRTSGKSYLMLFFIYGSTYAILLPSIYLPVNTWQSFQEIKGERVHLPQLQWHKPEIKYLNNPLAMIMWPWQNKT